MSPTTPLPPGDVAQLAEHLLCKERVRSSSLLVSTTRGRLETNTNSRHAGKHKTNIGAGHPTQARDARLSDGSSAIEIVSGSTVIAPLIRESIGSPTSGSLGSRPTWSAEAARPHLNNWICFGRLKIFNFAELCARCIPGHMAADRLVSCCGGQATKGTRWMPWRQEPMKDVAGCEKLRGVASRL